ncbi:MAG TPA: TlpA disulfide reductase family protein, partial [Saprospiraceae bacterium]|nr:TlpA disulfide reductase family protein [Saprospiraceae bacterium]
MKNLLMTAGLCVLVMAGYYVAKHFYLKPKNITGDKASEIKGKLPDGSTFSLKELHGRYVLLDFWGSWCMPCRQTHPQLKELFRRYRNQAYQDAAGFDIVSIGVEPNRENWQAAIIQDELDWPYQLLVPSHFDDPVTKAYNVKQLPTKFLINPQGIIIAVDPSIDEVAKLLEKRLKT